MNYSVKEIYYTLQGEGVHAGRAAVFLRFAGCNLWSGLERDRLKGPGACSEWCDTDFVGTDGPGGGRFPTADALASAVDERWPTDSPEGKFVVCTGGEPLLQLDRELIAALHIRAFKVAIETNGTRLPPPGVDWICVSPKVGSELALRRGDELKLVFPQPQAAPESFQDLDFSHFFLQPLENAAWAENTADAIRYCLANPRWRLSLQAHKFLGIP